MNKIEELFNKIKQKKRSTRILLYLTFVILLLLVYLAVAVLMGSFIKSIKIISGGAYENAFYYGIIYNDGRTLSIIACFVLTLVLLIVYFRSNYRNDAKTTDERGVDYLRKGTFGTSEWMSEEEAKKAYYVGDIANTTTTVYGQLSDNGEKVVGFKQKTYGGEGGENNLIIGSTGTGKSYSFVRTELIQTVLRGDSFITTDPSTELYCSLSQFCRNKGVDVKVLNCDDLNYSDCWNCLEETIDPRTERMDEQRVLDFVDVYMKNAKSDDDVKAEEKFWYDSAKNLLVAIIGYCGYQKEVYIISKYLDLYNKVASCVEKDITMNKMKYKSFPWARNEIYKEAKKNNYDLNKVNSIIEKIHASAPEYTISTVYDVVMNFDKYESEIARVEREQIARNAYDIFKTNSKSEQVRSSAIQGAQMKMRIFSDKRLRYVLSHSGIKLNECNEKQSAYFVLTSDKKSILKPIVSLFFSFLIRDAREEYARARQISQENGVSNPRLPITIMLDEFYSIGVIGGGQRSFATTLSNARKDKLRISIIVQQYSQIADLYGQEAGSSIQGNCDTIIFLGCNDPDTANFISEFVSGEATVLSEKHRIGGNVLSTVGNDLMTGAAARQLLTVGEARMWKDKILVAKRGNQPLALKPFPYTQHPVYLRNEIKHVSVYSTITNIEEYLENEYYTIDKENKENSQEVEIKLETDNLVPSFAFDPDTGEIL